MKDLLSSVTQFNHLEALQSKYKSNQIVVNGYSVGVDALSCSITYKSSSSGQTLSINGQRIQLP